MTSAEVVLASMLMTPEQDMAQLVEIAKFVRTFEPLPSDFSRCLANATGERLDLARAHAVVKHGEDANMVRRCMEEKGPVETWVKPDGREINVCKIADGIYVIMVSDGTREITSFIKAKMSRLSQIEQYLRNMGAERIWFP